MVITIEINIDDLKNNQKITIKMEQCLKYSKKLQNNQIRFILYKKNGQI